MKQITLEKVVKSEPSVFGLNCLNKPMLGMTVTAGIFLAGINYLTTHNKYESKNSGHGSEIRSFSKIDGMLSSVELDICDSDPGRVDIAKSSAWTYVKYADLDGDNRVDFIFMRPEFIMRYYQFPASLICPSERVEGNACTFKRKNDFRKYRNVFERFDRDLNYQKVRFGPFMRAKEYNIKTPGKHI